MPGEARSRMLTGAQEELAAVGQAAFTMEGVARRSFYSIGTVYKYWADKNALLTDLATESIGPDVCGALASRTNPAECIVWMLDEGRSQLILVGEVLLAGHADEQVGQVARELWSSVLEQMRRLLPSSMAWYVATYAIGNALLDVIGIPGPAPATGRVRWLTDSCSAAESIPQGVSRPSVSRDFGVPSDSVLGHHDATTLALIQAAHTVLTERGVQGASTRSIARAAGVTTGAVYRRYEAKSRLFADVLITELSPERYAWTWDLIGSFASADPYRNAAEVMTAQLITQSANAASQRVLLHLGIAARNDTALRDEIHRRIEAAQSARTSMFAHFIEVGLMRGDVDPAVFAWGFQALPVGNRVLAPLGFELDPSTVTEAMTSILSAAAERS